MAACGALVVLTAGCGAGDDGADGLSGATRVTTDEVTTTSAPTTEPPGSRPELVEPHVQELLDRYAEAVTTILADPSIVRDRGNGVVEDFLALFEEGGDFAETSLDAWLDYADRGVTLEPVSSEHPTIVANVDGPIRTVGDDEVSFAYCEVQRYIYEENGEEIERQDELLLPGTGQAVRVDGRWRLRSLATPPDMQGCFSGTEGR